MALVLNVFPIPSGGAIGLNLTTAVSGTVTLARATSGVSGLSAWTYLYSGAPLSNTGEAMFFLDLGDDTPAPLLTGTQYVYQLVDASGTIQSNPVATPSSITVEAPDFTPIIIGLLQGAINTASPLPEGVKPARVVNAMPIAGVPPLPLICVNPELEMQTEIPVGADNENVGDLIQPAVSNDWTQTGQEEIAFRLTVISTTATERDFYRRFIIAVLRTALAYALSQFGADLQRGYEATSYQSMDNTNLVVPGWYAADVLFSFRAMANVKISTSYGLIEKIIADIKTSVGDLAVVTTEVEVPIPL